MQLSQFKIKFIDLLKDEYPLREINSFFYLLTEAYIGMSRLDVALNPQRKLTETEENKFKGATKRLQNHEPLQYIIGKTEFFGLTFKVDENVLIPRPETEELVQWILDDFASAEKELKVLDIGTGSGCIAISLAKNLPQAKVTAIDISEKVLRVAQANADLNKVSVNFRKNDILAREILKEKYDIIVSNPPYVRNLEKKDMQRNVLEFEPDSALYVKDTDPLIFYKKITKLASLSLSKSGKLYFEINQYLEKRTEELLIAEGFKAELRKDIFGNYRMLKGAIPQ